MSKEIFIKVLSILVNALTCLILVLATDFLQGKSVTTHGAWAMPFPIAIGLAISGQSILSILKIQNTWQRIFLVIFTIIYISIGFGIIANRSFALFILFLIPTIVQFLFLKSLLPQKQINAGKIFFVVLISGLIVPALFYAAVMYSYSTITI